MHRAYCGKDRRASIREAEQTRRVVDQELPASGWIRRVERHQIDQVAVVRHHGNIRMRPVGSPEHPVRRGFDQRAPEGTTS